MERRIAVLAAALIAAAATPACTETDLPTAGATPRDAAAFAVASRSSSPVVRFTTSETGEVEVEVMGTSQLVRTNDGVSFRLRTTGLEPGTVHTLWMVIFNNPENCNENGCGLDDFDPSAGVEVDVVYAAGHVIGGAGRATFAGHRREGDNSGSILTEWLELPSPGLLDPRGAEIHFVVHSHGPKIPELAAEMLHSFNAGCGPIFDPLAPPVPESLGTHGPNECKDVQFAAHLP